MLRTEEHAPFTRIRMARTLFGRPIYEVSAFLVDGLLIDTGCPATARELLVWARGREIRRIVNTHHHEDHIGGDALLARELGLPISAPPATLPELARFGHLPFYRWLVWGRPEGARGEPLGAAIESERYRFEVIPTPGHAHDHVALFEPERRWLVSGDLYVHERVTYLRRIEDVHVHMASLRRLLALDPGMLICSHAGFIEDGAGALARKLAFWERIETEAHELRRQGVPVPEISRRLLGPEGWRTNLSLGDFSKRNLIRSLLAGEA